MPKFLKIVIVLWTLFCAGMFAYGAVVSFNQLIYVPKVTNAIIYAWIFGVIFSLAMWFGIWAVPTTVTLVLNWVLRSGKKVEASSISAPMVSHKISERASYLPQSFTEFLIVILIIVIVLAMFFVRR